MSTTQHDTLTSSDSSDLARQIKELGPWFHNLHLPDGTQTYPDHWLGGDFPAFKWRQIAPHVPQDLTGWSCLDIGCNAGFYTFELAKRGATVLGIDLDDHYLRQARWAAKQFDMEDRARFEKCQVYDLAHRPESEKFDLVLFMGVLYHLRYPMLGLDIVCQRVARRMIFQTLTMPGEEVFTDTAEKGFEDRELLAEPGWPKIAFFEHGFCGDPTNWWAPNHAAVEAMLRAAGMKVTARPGHEIYLCEPDPTNPPKILSWARPEFLAATGRGNC
jgi:tRNA (mo5U34)-methyltransferase